jgi:hypothetical protein
MAFMVWSPSQEARFKMHRPNGPARSDSEAPNGHPGQTRYGKRRPLVQEDDVPNLLELDRLTPARSSFAFIEQFHRFVDRYAIQPKAILL